MKITGFSFDNFRYDWHLEKVQLEEMNLLVGLSGVGKTRILQSILALRKIANGQTANGIKWNMDFLDSKGKQYNWSGEFSKAAERDDDDLEEGKSLILSEELLCDGKMLINRDKDRIKYRNNEVPRLHPSKSAIYLLKEEPINAVLTEINKISLYDHSNSTEKRRYFYRYAKSELVKEYKSINDIFNSGLAMSVRLLWIADNDKPLFGKIEAHFCDIFPFVEHIRIALLDNAYQATVPPFLRDVPLIQIKEKGMESWIPQFNISSGMFSTLMYLCELYLCAENSVLLIDELENSLGINCLSPISDEIVENKKNVQFIITSHHPTIINSIKHNSWKVVTRKAGIVSVSNYGIDTDESAHDPYLQLINSIEYTDGITK